MILKRQLKAKDGELAKYRARARNEEPRTEKMREQVNKYSIKVAELEKSLKESRRGLQE